MAASLRCTFMHEIWYLLIRTSSLGENWIYLRKFMSVETSTRTAKSSVWKTHKTFHEIQIECRVFASTFIASNRKLPFDLDLVLLAYTHSVLHLLNCAHSIVFGVYAINLIILCVYETYIFIHLKFPFPHVSYNLRYILQKRFSRCGPWLKCYWEFSGIWNWSSVQRVIFFHRILHKFNINTTTNRTYGMMQIFTIILIRNSFRKKKRKNKTRIYYRRHQEATNLDNLFSNLPSFEPKMKKKIMVIFNNLPKVLNINFE